MVGLCSGCAWRALGHIKPVHVRIFIKLATAHIVARITDKAREPLTGKEVSIKRNNHLRALEFINRIVIGAEGKLCSRANVIAIDRVPAMPLGLREGLLYGFHLPCKRRRAYSAGQKAQSCSLGRLER